MFARAATVEAAIDEVSQWAATLPGDFEFDFRSHADVDELRLTGTLIPSACHLTATIHVAAGHDVIDAPQYRFDLRGSDGELLWRHDRHPGHESEPNMTGQQHVHVVRDGNEVRMPDDVQTLATIREALVIANLDRAEGNPEDASDT